MSMKAPAWSRTDLLAGGAEAGRVGGVIREHGGAAAALEAVAADEVRLPVLEVAEARHVEAAGPAVVEGARLAHAGPSRGPTTPGPITCSQKLWPTWPLELPMPFGCGVDRESSRMRVDSRVDAPRTTAFAFTS